MALFQRKPQTDNPVNYVTIGLNKTILLVGLGNPGKKYHGTRHNIGFMCLDEFAEKSDEMESWVEKKDLKVLFSSGKLGDTRVIAIKPTTYMNLSGEAVQATAKFYKIQLEHVVAVHDELDVEFGQVRLRQGGGSAGHKGIKSISQHIGEGYGRIRVGIGPKQPAEIDSSDFVLQKFSKEEQAQLPNMVREVNAVLTEYVYGGELPQDTRSFIV